MTAYKRPQILVLFLFMMLLLGAIFLTGCQPKESSDASNQGDQQQPGDDQSPSDEELKSIQKDIDDLEKTIDDQELAEFEDDFSF